MIDFSTNGAVHLASPRNEINLDINLTSENELEVEVDLNVKYKITKIIKEKSKSPYDLEIAHEFVDMTNSISHREKSR